jgi:hypothetical protein
MSDKEIKIDKALIDSIEDPAAALALAKWLKSYITTLDGLDALDGVSVINAKIENTELIITLSDLRNINVGRVVGEQGPQGDPPEHRWVDSACLQFKNPDGTWGECIDLTGPPGPPGVGGLTGGGAGTPIITKLLTQNQGVNVNSRTEVIDFTGDVVVTKTGDKSVQVQIDRRDLMWFVVDVNTETICNAGYALHNELNEIEMLLPTNCKVGDKIKIMGYGTGGFKVTQRADQQVHFGTRSTSVGTAGYLQSVQAKSAISLICVKQDKEFMVESSVGNFKLN